MSNYRMTLASKTVALIVGSCFLLFATTASTQGGGVPNLQSQVDALAAQVAALQGQLAQVQTQLTIQATDPAEPALTVQAAPGQTANLQEWLDEDGDVVAALTASGDLVVTGSIVFGGGSCVLSEPVAGSCDIASTTLQPC